MGASYEQGTPVSSRPLETLHAIPVEVGSVRAAVDEGGGIAPRGHRRRLPGPYFRENACFGPHISKKTWALGSLFPRKCGLRGLFFTENAGFEGLIFGCGLPPTEQTNSLLSPRVPETVHAMPADVCEGQHGAGTIQPNPKPSTLRFGRNITSARKVISLTSGLS